MHADAEPIDNNGGAPPEPSEIIAPMPSARPEASASNVRLVRIVSLLLLVQTLLLLGISFWFFSAIDWDQERQEMLLSTAAVDAVAMGFWFTVAGVVLLPTALALFFLRKSAWIFAMAIQGVLLVVTLTNYFFSVAPTLERSFRVFMVMASCVVLVFYLNLTGVRTVVQWRDEDLEDHLGGHGTD